jgi:hypothetical protein
MNCEVSDWSLASDVSLLVEVTLRRDMMELWARWYYWRLWRAGRSFYGGWFRISVCIYIIGVGGRSGLVWMAPI